MQTASRLMRPFFCAAFVLAAGSLIAQTQFDPSRAVTGVQPSLASDALIRSQQEAVSRGLDDENAFAPPTPGDDDLGQQLILKRNEKATPFSIWADSSVFWTDNAANVNEGKQDDYFYVGGVNAAWQQRLKGRFYGDVYAGQHWYRYDEFSELDYEAGEVAAGFLVLLPELANSIFHVHYYYERITQDIDGDALYQTHNIRTGLQKTFLIDRLNSVNVSALASFALDTEPDILQRHEYTAMAGYNFKITRSLVLSLSYRLMYYDYFNFEDRHDWYHNASANLSWRPTEYLELAAGYNYSFNNSNLEVFDYESQLAGPSVALKFKF